MLSLLVTVAVGLGLAGSAMPAPSVRPVAGVTALSDHRTVGDQPGSSPRLAGQPRWLVAGPAPGPPGGSGGGDAPAPGPVHHEESASSSGDAPPVEHARPPETAPSGDKAAGSEPPPAHHEPSSAPAGAEETTGQHRAPPEGIQASGQPRAPAPGAKPVPARDGAAPPSAGPVAPEMKPAPAPDGSAAAPCGPPGSPCAEAPKVVPSADGSLPPGDAGPQQLCGADNAPGCVHPKPSPAAGSTTDPIVPEMSKGQALAAMGIGAFKVADGALGTGEGELIADTGYGAIPGIAMMGVYAAMVAEGGQQFGDGFGSFFGDHKPATIIDDPANPGMTVNATRPSDGVGEPKANVAAGPKNPDGVDSDAEQGPVSRRGAFDKAKKDLGISDEQVPKVDNRAPLTGRDGNVVLGDDGLPIYTREYHYTRPGGEEVVSQEHSVGHEFGENGVGDQGSHFNVRPLDKAGKTSRNGRVEGTRDHYPFVK